MSRIRTMEKREGLGRMTAELELLLVCAGSGVKDYEGLETERPLRSRGKRQADRAGSWLGQNGMVPDSVVTAGDRRSRATAQKALKAAGWPGSGCRKSRKLSEGCLPALPVSGRVLLVARAGPLEKLLEVLGLTAELASGDLVQVTVAAGLAELKLQVAADGLPDAFPFPAPDGPERRARPAYYYSQSAVIPYRRTSSGIQILIVSSSNGRHWVVPKAVVDPLLGPARSASMQARLEAGVEGVVGSHPVGAFAYNKWGGACTVEVYAMEVTAELKVGDWPENWRERRWMSAENAAEALYQDAFAPMIAQLA